MEFISQAKLDFHDFGLLTEFDVELKLEQFLEDCHIRSYSQVLVVTGKGQMVRPLVNKLLSRHRLVKEFQQAGYFNGQSGAFEVTLAD